MKKTILLLLSLSFAGGLFLAKNKTIKAAKLTANTQILALINTNKKSRKSFFLKLD